MWPEVRARESPRELRKLKLLHRNLNHSCVSLLRHGSPTRGLHSLTTIAPDGVEQT